MYVRCDLAGLATVIKEDIMGRHDNWITGLRRRPSGSGGWRYVSGAAPSGGGWTYVSGAAPSGGGWTYVSGAVPSGGGWRYVSGASF